MHKLLDKYLCEKYPKIFSERNKPMSETCMCWGFTFNDGWFYLIDNLCYQIQYRIDNPPYNQDGKVEISQVIAQQVKEKYGTLRFYYSGGDKIIDGMVRMVESLSGSICEDCGKIDNSIGRTQGWIKTCCEKHSDDRIWKNCNDKKLNKIWEQIKHE